MERDKQRHRRGTEQRHGRCSGCVITDSVTTSKPSLAGAPSDRPTQNKTQETEPTCQSLSYRLPDATPVVFIPGRLVRLSQLSIADCTAFQDMFMWRCGQAELFPDSSDLIQGLVERTFSFTFFSGEFLNYIKVTLFYQIQLHSPLAICV